MSSLDTAQGKKRASRKVAYESAGPLQLAEQGDGRPKDGPTNYEWVALRQHAESRLVSLTNYRFSWAAHWGLLETYILPRRGIFINATQPTPNSMNRGAAVNQSIVDPTGTQAMRVCAAGLMSGLMSPGRPWFKLKPALFERTDLDAEAEDWFEEVEDRMYTVMGRSNFYDSGAQMFEDLTTFGTGPFIIYEDERDVIRCYTPCPGEYFLASGSSFRVESLYRKFIMTIAQIVEMFGIENCPADVVALWNTKGATLEQERIVAHAIEPNFPVSGYGPEVGVVKGGWPWRELYWVWGTTSARPLSMRGFNDQPHVCPRWATTSNDAYGRSLGMDVLPDIMQLQVETLRKAEAIEKMVRPPLLASMELKNEPSSILPGHLTYVPSLGPDKGMRPVYTVNPQVEHLMQDLMQIQQRVKAGFLNDLFLLLAQSTKDMTAYEVAQRQQEKLQVLGPVIERFQNEFAAPAIKRIFRIMERKRLLPPLPASLQGQPLGIEYTSVLSLAQKAASTAGMERFVQMSTALSQQYPEAHAVLDAGEFLREYGTQLDISKKFVRSQEQVDQIMAQEAKARQAQAGLAAAQQAADVAKTTSEVDLGGGMNAASLMLGLAGAGTQQGA